MSEVMRLSLDLEYPFQYREDAEGNLCYYADYAALKAERDALAAENVGMDKFVDSLLSIAWQGGSADGAGIQELALNHGLIRQESYCADTHESLVEDPGNFEEGDEVYFRVETPATDAYLNLVRADAVNHAGKMVIAMMNHQDKGVERALEYIAEVELQYTLANQLHAKLRNIEEAK